MSKNNEEDITKKDLNKLLEELDLKSESEISEMVRNWENASCVLCGRPIKLTNCAFVNGDPCCKKWCK